MKEINANRFFWDSHWLEIWKNHLCSSLGPDRGSVAMDYRSTLIYCGGYESLPQYCSFSSWNNVDRVGLFPLIFFCPAGVCSQCWMWRGGACGHAGERHHHTPRYAGCARSDETLFLLVWQTQLYISVVEYCTQCSWCRYNFLFGCASGSDFPFCNEAGTDFHFFDDPDRTFILMAIRIGFSILISNKLFGSRSDLSGIVSKWFGCIPGQFQMQRRVIPL